MSRNDRCRGKKERGGGKEKQFKEGPPICGVRTFGDNDFWPHCFPCPIPVLLVGLGKRSFCELTWILQHRLMDTSQALFFFAQDPFCFHCASPFPFTVSNPSTVPIVSIVSFPLEKQNTRKSSRAAIYLLLNVRLLTEGSVLVFPSTAKGSLLGSPRRKLSRQ